MLKVFARIIGAVVLLAGVGAAVAHYVIESSSTGKFITLALAAVLLVGGWALFDWGMGISRRRGRDWSQGSGQK